MEKKNPEKYRLQLLKKREKRAEAKRMRTECNESFSAKAEEIEAMVVEKSRKTNQATQTMVATSIPCAAVLDAPLSQPAPKLPQSLCKCPHADPIFCNRVQRVSYFNVNKDLIHWLKLVGSLKTKGRSWDRFNNGSLHTQKAESPALGWLKHVSKTITLKHVGGVSEIEEMEQTIKETLECAMREGLCIDAGVSDWYLGFLSTLKEDHGQEFHVDYKTRILKCEGNTGGRKCVVCGQRRCCCSYEKRVPYTVLIPLEPGGSQIKICEHVNIFVAPSVDNMTHSHTVHIPFGHGIIFRGDVLHSGALGCGDLRAHLYVYTGSGGIQHDQDLRTVTKSETGANFSDYIVDLE